MGNKPYIDLGEIYASPKNKVAHVGDCRPILNKTEVKDRNGNSLQRLIIKEAKLYRQTMHIEIGNLKTSDAEIALSDIPNLCAYCKGRILRYLELSKQLMLPKEAKPIHNPILSCGLPLYLTED